MPPRPIPSRATRRFGARRGRGAGRGSHRLGRLVRRAAARRVAAAVAVGRERGRGARRRRRRIRRSRDAGGPADRRPGGRDAPSGPPSPHGTHHLEGVDHASRPTTCRRCWPRSSPSRTAPSATGRPSSARLPPRCSCAATAGVIRVAVAGARCCTWSWPRAAPTHASGDAATPAATASRPPRSPSPTDGRGPTPMSTCSIGVLARTGDVSALAAHDRGCTALDMWAQVVERELFVEHGWGWLRRRASRRCRPRSPTTEAQPRSSCGGAWPTAPRGRREAEVEVARDPAGAGVRRAARDRPRRPAPSCALRQPRRPSKVRAA